MEGQLLHINKQFILTVICFLISIIIVAFNNKSKINILDIIKKHVCTLKNFREEKISLNDISIFFILPVFIAIILLLNITLGDTKLGILVTVFTIFIGLLFNILAILLAFDSKKNTNIDKIFMKEILYNVSFAIIISISVLIICIVKFINMNNYLNIIFQFLLYYMVVVFILTLFMILKRLFNLLIKKIEDE